MALRELESRCIADPPQGVVNALSTATRVKHQSREEVSGLVMTGPRLIGHFAPKGVIVSVLWLWGLLTVRSTACER